MRKIAMAAWRSVLDILFPPLCLGCGKHIPDQKRLLCENCFGHIECGSAFACPRCGARLAEPNIRCHPQEPYILGAATSYADPMPSLIRYFKYGKLRTLEWFLSALLIVYLKHISFLPDGYIVTPIPLHPWKEKKRGFNQSEMLARHVADYFSLPCVPLLKRVRYTPSQVGQKLADRHMNLSGCFEAKQRTDIQNARVLLVDDVSTTGATLHEACMTLKRAGVKKIICLVVSKA